MTLREFDEWYRARYHRTSSWLITTAMMLADFLGIMISFGSGFFIVKIYYIIQGDWGGLNFKSFITYWPYLPIFFMLFQILHLYPGVSLAPAEELRRIMLGSFLSHGSIILSRYIENTDVTPVSVSLFLSFVFSTIILLFSRDFMHFVLHRIRLKSIPAVIYGSNDTGRLVVDRLLKSTKAGYTPVLILDDDPESGDEYRGIPIIHDPMLGPELVRTYNLKMAIVAMPVTNQKRINRIMNYSVSAFRYSVVVPGFSNASNIWMTVRDFDGVLGFATSNKLKMRWNLAIKRFLDIVFVCIGGIILLPFLLLIGLIIKLSSPGPVLYGHKRIGLNGRQFRAMKFRTMVADADQQLENLLSSDPELRREWDDNFKLKKDPRVTKIGKFLRRTSFDEFPQLLNILKGEMSLVGPRPVVEEEKEKYGENFERIFSVKPGLTGLWQISGRSNTDYMERIAYDTYYLRSWSVWLDIWILYRTPGQIIRGRGAY